MISAKHQRYTLQSRAPALRSAGRVMGRRAVGGVSREPEDTCELSPGPPAHQGLGGTPESGTERRPTLLTAQGVVVDCGSQSMFHGTLVSQMLQAERVPHSLSNPSPLAKFPSPNVTAAFNSHPLNTSRWGFSFSLVLVGVCRAQQVGRELDQLPDWMWTAEA